MVSLVAKAVARVFECLENSKISGINLSNESFRTQLSSVIEEIYNSKSRADFKVGWHKMVDLFLHETDIPFSPEDSGKLPILWVGKGLGSKMPGSQLEFLLSQDGYSGLYSALQHSPVFNLTQKIITEIVDSQQPSNGDSHFIKRNRSDLTKRNRHLLFELKSEVFVEHVDISDIKDLKIEFGQHLTRPRGKIPKLDEISVPSDSIMFMNELPIILARVADYNVSLTDAERRLKAIDLQRALKNTDEVIYKLPDSPEVKKLSDGQMIIRTRKYPNDLPEPKPFVISIKDMQDFIEQARRKYNRLLTVKETLQALRDGALSDEHCQSSISALAGILTKDTVEAACNDAIPTKSKDGIWVARTQ